MKIFSKVDNIKADKIEVAEINVNDCPVVTSNVTIKINKITQAEYDDLPIKDANTLYIIVE